MDGCAERLEFSGEDRGPFDVPGDDDSDEAFEYSFDFGDATADAILVGDPCSKVGQSVTGAGDVDGDGFADLLVGAPGDIGGGGDIWQLGATGGAYLVHGPVYGVQSMPDIGTKLVGYEEPLTVGWAVSSAGDHDGDGRSELLLNAYNWNQSFINSVVYIIDDDVEGAVSLASADVRLESTEDCFGRAITSVGDTNGDGHDDILVGAQCDDEAGIEAGGAYLFTGPLTSGDSIDSAAAKFVGEAEDDHAGYYVAPAGDMDDNGLADVLISAPMADPEMTYLMLAPFQGHTSLAAADARFEGSADHDGASSSVAGGEDADGDGHEDVLISSISSQNDDAPSVVYLVLGPSMGNIELVHADARYSSGMGGHDGLGSVVAFAGDVDGDGTSDLLMSAPGYKDEDIGYGTVFLVLGPSLGDVNLSTDGLILDGPGGSHHGIGLSGVGDMNDDGFGDFAMSQSDVTTDVYGSGAVFLFYGGEPFR